MTTAFEASARVTSDSVMPPTPASRMRADTSSLPSFSNAPMMASHRTLHVALDDESQFLAAEAFLQVAHHVHERAVRTASSCSNPLTLLTGAILGDFAGTGFVRYHRHAVARIRSSVEAEYLHRHRRAGIRDALALVVDEGADTPPLGTSNDDVAGEEGAALHEHRGHGTATAIELGLDDRALAVACLVGTQV